MLSKSKIRESEVALPPVGPVPLSAPAGGGYSGQMVAMIKNRLLDFAEACRDTAGELEGLGHSYEIFKASDVSGTTEISIGLKRITIARIETLQRELAGILLHAVSAESYTKKQEKHDGSNRTKKGGSADERAEPRRMHRSLV